MNATNSLAVLLKAGGGDMLPHSENTILGQTNKVGSKEMQQMSLELIKVGGS